MLVPEVEGTGLPLTELLPYTKSEIKQIKRTNHKFKDRTCRIERMGKIERKTNREGEEECERESEERPDRKAGEETRTRTTATIR